VPHLTCCFSMASRALVLPARLDAGRVLGLLTRTRAGMTEEELDAAVDVIAALDAGVLQSLNQRIKQRNKT
jgi:hypothetical protein